jgi:hypothetical protein
MKRVAIIGAGPAGLVAAKSMVAKGFETIVFEKFKTLGGLWNPLRHRSWGDDLTTNLSKFTCCFSDHPWPLPSSPMLDLFPTQQQLYEYLLRYQLQYLQDETMFRYQCEVIRIEQTTTATAAITRNWEVQWYDEQRKLMREEFDYVVVATGFFGEPALPSEIVSEGFSGEVIHSNDFKNSLKYEGKRVAVIGGSHNAAEIASNVSFYAKTVYHIAPRPFWPMPRLLPINPSSSVSPYLPLDLVFYQRASHDTFEKEIALNSIEKNQSLDSYFRSFHGSAAPYCPSESLRGHPPVIAISDYYSQMIQSNKIHLLFGRVGQVTNTGDLFTSTHSRGNQPSSDVDALPSSSHSLDLEPTLLCSGIDAIIFCTGYRTQFPFFSPLILETLQHRPHDNDQFLPLLTHRSMIHPDLPGLGFVGMYRGPYFGIMEKQAVRILCSPSCVSLITP